VILAGISGSGKTRLAFEYASKSSRSEYPFVWWLDATNNEILAAGLERLRYLADATVASAAATPAALVHQILQAAGPTARGLIVLDGAPDITPLKDVIDAFGQCNVLVTTTGAWPTSIHIGPLKPEQSLIAFVQDHTNLSEADARVLINSVGGLPLGLHHACDYIARTGTDIATYARRLEEDHELWVDSLLTPLDYSGELLRVAAVSLEAAESDAEISRAMALFGVSGSGPFPMALLRRVIGQDTGQLLNRLASSFSVELDSAGQSIFIHPIIRAALRAFYPTERLEEASRALETGLLDLMLHPDSDGLYAEMAMLLAPHVTALNGSINTVIIAAALAEACENHPFVAEELLLYSRAGFANVPLPQYAPEPSAYIWHIRAAVTASLGWLYRKRGRLSYALGIVQTELESVNSAGYIGARANLLHILAHLLQELYGNLENVIQVFRQAISAARVSGTLSGDYASLLTCTAVTRIESADREAAGDPQFACRQLRLAHAEISEALETLENEWQSSGHTWSSLSEKCEVARLLIAQKHARLGCSCDVRMLTESSDSEPPTPEGQTDYRSRLWVEPRESQADSVSGKRFDEICTAAMDALSTNDYDRSLNLAKDAIGLGREIHGDGSRFLVEPYYIGAISANRLDLQEEARALVEELAYISFSLWITSPKEIVLMLGRIIDLPGCDSYERVLRSAPRAFANHEMPAVSAICWLMLQASPMASPVQMKAIRTRVSEILRWRAGSEKIAGGLVHLVGHANYLSRKDSLHCHRLAVGILRRRPEDLWALGTSLYCLGHRLHEINENEAAMRRYWQAREIFAGFLGVDCEEVRHLDFHLNNPDKPYGEVEVEVRDN
jgi:tetratricopeptide (TPR) repeat protein